MYSEDVVENRSVRQKVKSQDSQSQIFFLKEKNIENIRLVLELKSGEMEFYLEVLTYFSYWLHI